MLGYALLLVLLIFCVHFEETIGTNFFHPQVKSSIWNAIRKSLRVPSEGWMSSELSGSVESVLEPLGGNSGHLCWSLWALTISWLISPEMLRAMSL